MQGGENYALYPTVTLLFCKGDEVGLSGLLWLVVKGKRPHAVFCFPNEPCRRPLNAARLLPAELSFIICRLYQAE